MRTFSVMSILAMSSIIACSSSSAPKSEKVNEVPPGETPPAPSDNGTPTSDPAPSSPPAPSSSDAGSPTPPTNQATCIAACELSHPKAAALGKQLDATCYLAGVCEPSCNNVPPGKNFPAASNADAAAPVACPGQFAEGVDPIMTPSAACSTCLAETPACCTLWVSIFGSPEGRDLNKCAVACYTNFKN